MPPDPEGLVGHRRRHPWRTRVDEAAVQRRLSRRAWSSAQPRDQFARSLGCSAADMRCSGSMP